ncbi:hypothetical protein SD78_1047 [Bacillus badius]|nr:hypothetical protein SD78_1047 [Bacillus badius]
MKNDFSRQPVFFSNTSGGCVPSNQPEKHPSFISPVLC